MVVRGRYTPKPTEIIVPSPTGQDWRWRSEGEDLVLEKWNGVDTWVRAETTKGS